jgi:predicted XRE-type DNA-binding protein
MIKIPVFLFEEHHEAFFVWHYAIKNNWLSKTGNTLLHIDEHSDMAAPRFNYSLNSLNGNLQDIYDFTYNELTIENFIVPTIYQGLFNKLYWIRQSKEIPLPSLMCVYSHDREGKILTAKSFKELGNQALFDPSYKKVKFQCLKIDEIDRFPDSQSVVLDIDLDYFSCNNQSYNFKGELEITEEQYYSFDRDPYQFMRLTLGSRVKTKCDRGKYYLVFNEFPKEDDETIPNSLKVSETEIIHRIDRIIEFLQVKQVEIKAIDICRSRISGFTPEDQCQFIEDRLIEKLSKIYDLEVQDLKKIYQQEKIATRSIYTTKEIN